MRLTARQYANVLVDFLEKQGSVNEETAHAFLTVLRKNRQERLLGRIMMISDNVWKERQNEVDVIAKVPKKLSDEEVEKMTAMLEKSLKKKVNLRQEENSSLRGGVALRVGDRLYDATVSGKLRSLRRQINF